MRQSTGLLILLLVLSLVGTLTEWNVNGWTGLTRIGWKLFLIGVPLVLTGPVWMGWRWAVMGCVIYATIGLALDLVTIISLAGSHEEARHLLSLSSVSGLLNFSLIVVGGRRFARLLTPPESRPPSPRSPFSSSEP